MQTNEVLFRALADPTRRAIFERLCRQGDRTVGELTAFAKVSQPVVSRHLRQLREAGLVRGQAKGRQTYYSARPGELAPLADWTQEMTRFWAARLDGLETLLERMDQ